MSELTDVACAEPDCADGRITTDGYCYYCGASGPAPVATVVTVATGATVPLPARPQDETTPKNQDPRRLPRLNVPGVADRPVLIPDPAVSANLRECAACGARVALPLGNRPAELDGFCGRCGQRYSFTVKLARGERVGHYTVHGVIAHGGLGWVYAATNDRLGDEDVQAWVVLKGLLDAANPEARRIADVERRILSTVNHPNIVRIVDFVRHKGEEYIVMEYVPGIPLSRLAELRERGPDNQPAPLPPADALRYLLRLLPALSYLHRRGLVYCDLKPDNIMITSEQVVLIDLGGARRLDDYVSGFLSTPGYRAPELEDGEFRPPGVTRHGIPTVASDIFAITRTLARLMLGRFPGFLDTYRHTIPPRERYAPLRRFESLDHLLRRGTATDPRERFASVSEFGEELTGVLYEIVSRTEGRVPPLASRWFEPELHPTGEATGGPAGGPPPAVWEILPELRFDADDPQARMLAAIPGEDAAALADRLAAVEPATLSALLALANAQLRAGRTEPARATVDRMAATYPRDWRVIWCRGVLDLAAGQATTAAAAFERVFARVPGELPPRLALAAACEAASDRTRAAGLYDAVGETDPTITSAAFGLARCVDDPARRLAAYQRVPPSAYAYTASRVRMIGVLVGSLGPPIAATVSPARAPAPDTAATGTAAVMPTTADLESAEAILADRRLELAERRRVELRLDILAAALRVAGARSSGRGPGDAGSSDAGPGGAASRDAAPSVLGRPLVEHDLRLGLEEAYREIARLTRDRRERIRLVDEANRVRPRTLS